MNIAGLLLPKSTVAYLYDDFTLRQALEKMRYHGYTLLPVITRDNRYFGTISEGLKHHSGTLEGGAGCDQFFSDFLTGYCTGRQIPLGGQCGTESGTLTDRHCCGHDPQTAMDSHIGGNGSAADGQIVAFLRDNAPVRDLIARANL